MAPSAAFSSGALLAAGEVEAVGAFDCMLGAGSLLHAVRRMAMVTRIVVFFTAGIIPN
jgi:hypothetical protein